jgi:tRNA 2-selenouridine synthase
MMAPAAGTVAFADVVLSGAPVIDVRAPVEFAAGAIPGSVNLPILNDHERQMVGTTYKRDGNDAAVQQGYLLVGGDVKDARVAAWRDHIDKHPGTLLTCFRGGMRSKITQQWLHDVGVNVPRIEGGTKAARQCFVDATDAYAHAVAAHATRIVVVGGATGSGKTAVLQTLEGTANVGVLDLEAHAHHRGSAFGALDVPQPRQVNFENGIALALLRHQHLGRSHLAVEDESNMIGQCTIPLQLFAAMRGSSVVVVEESIDSRVELTFQDYVLTRARDDVFARYRAALQKITKRLGAALTTEIIHDLDGAVELWRSSGSLDAHRVWIHKLLTRYYDPIYESSFKKRAPQVLFRGSRAECTAFLQAV